MPTFNSETVVGDCLASIKRQTTPPLDIVVCDGGSTDGTVEISKENGAKVVQEKANRSAQRNSGALNARGEYVLFVDSDMRLTSHVLEECVAKFKESDAAIVIPEVDVGKSYWARVRAFERTFYKDASWLHAARFFRKSQFLEVGGFDVGLVGPEDWDLDERIRCFGDVREIRASIEHNEGLITFRGLMEKKSHYAPSFEIFKDRHPRRAALCLSGSRRAALIAKQPVKILSHPILASSLLALGFTELLVAHGKSKRWISDVEERPFDRE